MAEEIPVIDFSAYGLSCSEGEASRAELETLAQSLVHTLSTVGFTYLTHVGISQQEVDELFEVSDRFFALPIDVKEKYRRPSDGSRGRHGWVAIERERVAADRPGDLKEAFNMLPPLPPEQTWPNELPELEKVGTAFFDKCVQLTLRILEVMAIGLNVPDIPGFLDLHRSMGKGRNSSLLRPLRYPPVPDCVKDRQIRCGEHTDYGSITLLWQDGAPGLEIETLDHRWVPVPPIPGTVVVNIGDMMQRWSGDKLRSTPHRVVLPDEEEWRKVPRRSIPFFVHPDDDALLTCLDGSDKYPPMTAEEHLKNFASKIYADLPTAFGKTN
ncbi:PREDICTED: UPF0676 protein C1494.01-like [Branchiostoma belcheri]|uniref:UPF0676 protein C1494.01-like n=1 Tax=Branchiostoma belcheri TaxID=7741 RepID=A0A6P4YG84_BRABE|nr:PREDICTED: UPF0676 protein C1494.01-like [Branchiostoma belcheri]